MAETPPGRTFQTSMGGKQKAKVGKKETSKTPEAKQPKKTGKAVCKASKNASGGSFNEEEAQGCSDVDDSLSGHKEVTDNKKQRGWKKKQAKEPKKTKKETQSPKQALKVKGQKAEISTKKDTSNVVTEKGATGRGRAAKSKQILNTPEGKKGNSKPSKFANRKNGKKVVEMEDERSESEDNSSERESEEGKEESEYAEEPELSGDSSDRKVEGKSELEEEEEDEEDEGLTSGDDIPNSAPEESLRRVTGKGDTVEAPISSEEELLAEDKVDKSGPETVEESTDLQKYTRALNITSERLGQKIGFKKRKNAQDEGTSVSKPLQIKGLGLSKTDAAKGKSQILQLASKTKSLAQTDKDENPGSKVSAVSGPKSLFNRQSCAMMTLKGKGKDKKANQDGNEEFTNVKENGENIKSKQATSQMKNPKTVENFVKLTSKSAKQRDVTTLRRMSGWMQKKMPRSNNIHRKMRAITQAIGVSKWLVVHISKKKSSPSSGKNFFRQRMAMRVASRRNRQKSSVPQENTAGPSEDPVSSPCETQSGQDEKTNPGDAKYAIVFPRMTKSGQCQGNTPVSSTSRGTGESTAEPKPPKPGARLVLPTKPDLTVLKSVRKNIPENKPSRNENTEHQSTQANDNEDNVTPNSNEGVNVLQAAREKLGSSQFKLTKLSLSRPTVTAGLKTAHTKDGEERERSVAAPSADSDRHRQALVSSLYEEEADREVAQLMGDGVFTSSDIHWSHSGGTFGDPQDWLRTESLLPHQTVEKLTKWTVYQDDERPQTVPLHNGRGPWESEDPTQNMLESKLNSNQVLTHYTSLACYANDKGAGCVLYFPLYFYLHCGLSCRC